MWTSTLDLSPKRVVAARLLGPVWPGVYYSNFAPLRVQNLPRQSLPLPSWVRVRNRLAGISADDLRLISARGDTGIASAAIPRRQTTYVGHEVVGEVIEVGDEVKHLSVGDRVTLQYNPNCVSAGVQPLCHSCAADNYNLCEYGPLPGPQPCGGGWSEEMLVHEQQLFRIPPALSDEQAVLLESAAAAIHAVLRRLPQPDERVLIIGAGAVGLLTLQVLRALAPQVEISVLARHSFQVEQATRLGASHIIYPQDSYIGIQRVTQARLYHRAFGNRTLLGGYDLIYDTIGQRKTVHHALRWARARATVVLVGISPNMMHIDLTPIWNQEINLLGSAGLGLETWPIGSDERQSTFSVAAEMIAAGQIHPEQLVTHHFALPDFRNALMTAANKAHSRAVRVVFDYSLQPASVVPTVRASAGLRQYRPATIATRRSIRPLARGQGTYTQPADLPVTPLPMFEPDPLIPVQAMPEGQITPIEPETVDEDLEDTLVAIPIIRKPEQPAYAEQDAIPAQQEEATQPEQPDNTAEPPPEVPAEQEEATQRGQVDDIAEPAQEVLAQPDETPEPEQPVFEAPAAPISGETAEPASEPAPDAAPSETVAEEAAIAEPGETTAGDAEAPADTLLSAGKSLPRPRSARSRKRNRKNS
jgi:threonine dehydrogenase-like Zn-dependent dehydrogenase